jgi:hypothetical protein
MAHEHEWKEFNTVTSMTLKYKQVFLCTGCRTFRVLDNNDEWQEIT